MSSLESMLAARGLQYFRSGEEFLLVFRGASLDHYILLREGSSFIHASCLIGRAPEPLDPQLARYLLEWNTRHSMARAAIGNGEFVLLADLPLQGLQDSGVEELVLSVATAAEDLSTELLPHLLDGLGQPSSATPQSREADGLSAARDSEIDWDAEDI